jgi:predicted nucleotidyltransferase
VNSYVFSLSPFEQDAVKRVVSLKIDGGPVKFVSLEDLLILKTIAGRPRDLEDIRGVLAKNRRFDRSLVLHWLRAYDQELDEGFERRFLEVEKSLGSR